MARDPKRRPRETPFPPAVAPGGDSRRGIVVGVLAWALLVVYLGLHVSLYARSFKWLVLLMRAIF